MFSSANTATAHRRVGSGGGLRDLAVRRGVDRQLTSSAETVEAVLAAGRQLIARDEVLDFNVRELLELAGISNRAFYRHFPSKQAVIDALAEEVYDTMLRSLSAVVEANADNDPTAQLAAWVDESLTYARDPNHAARGRVFVAYEARLLEEHAQLYRSVGQALTRQVESIVERGVKEGVFAADTARAYARLAVRLVIATLQHHVLARTKPSARERDELVTFLLDACGARQRAVRSPRSRKRS